MAQATETVTLKLPSGEEIDVVVPQGMSDSEIHSLMQMKHPDMVPPPGVKPTNVPGLTDNAPASIVPPTPPPPSAPDMSQSAGSRFWGGIKAGIGGENALNTGVDPNHPFSTNAMVPGAGVYRDLKSGNVAGALGRIAGPAAELLPFAGGLKTGKVVENPVPEIKPPKTAPEFMKYPWSGERTGLPYQPDPHFTPRPEPAAPIPARSGLMLSGKVEPALGSPENPGIHSKIPLRVPRSVLTEEAAASSSEPQLSQYGQPRRGRMGPPLRPNVFSSEEAAQIYDNQMSRLGAEAKDAGMYSAARGAVRRIPDYQERIGRTLNPYGGEPTEPVDLQESEDNLKTKKSSGQ